MGLRAARLASYPLAIVVGALAAGCSLDGAGTAQDVPIGDSSVDTNLPLPDLGTEAARDTTTDGVPVDTQPADSIVTADGADTAPDAIVDTAPETPTCDDSACGKPPSGMKRMALVDRSVTCPAGFTTTDVVETWAAAAASAVVR